MTRKIGSFLGEAEDDAHRKQVAYVVGTVVQEITDLATDAATTLRSLGTYKRITTPPPTFTPNHWTLRISNEALSYMPHDTDYPFPIRIFAFF